jgi:hypothetical protein
LSKGNTRKGGSGRNTTIKRSNTGCGKEYWNATKAICIKINILSHFIFIPSTISSRQRHIRSIGVPFTLRWQHGVWLFLCWFMVW